jgi:oligopeptide transport system permease protein
LAENVHPEIQQRQLEFFGLDQPLHVQYFTYLSNLVRGDLGTSLRFIGRQVTTVIAETFPISAALGISALIVSETIGLLFGVLSSQFRNKWPDYLIMTVAILGVAMPSMVVGPLLRFAFGVQLQILPVSGWGTWEQMVMPVFVLALARLAGVTRTMRASMLGTSTHDYIKTARSKGLSPPRIVMRHQFKNSLLPIVTGLGPAMAGIIMGSFVVEQIFVIPGLGRHFVNAVTTLDYPMVMGLTIFYGAFLVTAMLLVDIVYALIDPRIRFN